MNEDFLKRMKIMLGAEFEAYLKTLDEKSHRGLRVNTLKCTPEILRNKLGFDLQSTSISPNVFRISNDLEHLGTSIYHRQGLYYLQEISASSAVEILDPNPGDWVLDLCAAPGGKTTQIAMKLQNVGYLFTNEIDSGRAQILLSNCERCGVSNAIITNNAPSDLVSSYKGWMDKILVDAPCSGEGMFKRKEKALDDWSIEHVRSCAIRQKKILDDAYLMLSQNSILVYSTCTYSMEENEEVIDHFLRTHPTMELIDCDVNIGRAGYDFGLVEGNKVRRIFPMDGGDGHFIAKLKKKSCEEKTPIKSMIPISSKVVDEFLNEQVSLKLNTFITKDKCWISNQNLFQLPKLKLLRQGIYLGEIIKERLEPHQHFYSAALLQNHYLKQVECTEEEINSVLKGNILEKQTKKGYVALSYEGINIAFGKSDNSIIKNKVPKGLRTR